MKLLLVPYFISFTALLYKAYCGTTCSGNIFEQQAPQFQIVASAKTGSTSLYAYLCQHPSVACLAKRKETNLLRSRMRNGVSARQIILAKTDLFPQGI